MYFYKTVVVVKTGQEVTLPVIREFRLCGFL